MNWEMFVARCLVYLLPLGFIGLVIYVYRPWAKNRYQKYAQSLFDDKGSKLSRHDSGDSSFWA